MKNINTDADIQCTVLNTCTCTSEPAYNWRTNAVNLTICLS